MSSSPIFIAAIILYVMLDICVCSVGLAFLREYLLPECTEVYENVYWPVFVTSVYTILHIIVLSCIHGYVNIKWHNLWHVGCYIICELLLVSYWSQLSSLSMSDCYMNHFFEFYCIVIAFNSMNIVISVVYSIHQIYHRETLLDYETLA